MDVYPLILAGLLGLVLGSFYNVCVYRWIEEMSLTKPLRSICPKCKAPLVWYDNIPLLGFLMLRGRCRQCSEPISWRYPLLEAVSAAWAVLLAWKYGLGPEFATLIVIGGMFLVASFIDFEVYLLPDVITLPGAAIGFAASVFVLREGIVKDLAMDAGLGMVMGAGLFYLLGRGYKLLRGVEGLGLGDVKLMLMIGALVGASGLPLTIILGAVSALLASIFYMIRSGSGARTPIPFGPFLSFACMVYLLWGVEIWKAYLGLYR